MRTPGNPALARVVGTLMLAILAGSKRCAPVAGVRGDGVAAQAPGLKGLVSEDSLKLIGWSRARCVVVLRRRAAF